MTQAFTLPDLGEGIHEAKIQDIRVAVGDVVHEEQIILVLETDKAVVEVPSPYGGIVEDIRVAVGNVVHVGEVLMTFSDGAAATTAAPEPAPRRGQPVTPPAPAAPAPVSSRAPHQPAASLPDAQPPAGPVPASPATRRLARQLGVDLHQVPASGPAGRVTAEDVRAFAQRRVAAAEIPTAPAERPEQAPAPSPSAESETLPDFSRWGAIELLPLRSVRRATAARMAQAWTHIPHVTHHDLADITALERCRQAWAPEIVDGTLTLLLFVMKAVVAALKQHPRFNASLDTQAQAIILKHYYHLGIAVDTERGLIVPVIRDVDRKSIAELAAELHAVVQRTRNGETTLEDLQGGTFTMTNIGRLGGRGFTPIINYPQVAILGMARAHWQPVVQRPGAGEEMAVVPRFMLPLILAFDHRVVDGADAARFLQVVIDMLEKPDTLVLRV